ncbi:MAG: extracellular solute-binding protein [Erysipelotrichaceae bacterium]|nr:extracellular solute-binding protein [Erysipelotrichaceae bacterium]MBQ2584436.1 extracellular solute-binding protein [Erysipelotrichaceae bacterium]
MKKLLALLLAMLMVFSLTACNNGGGEEEAEKPGIYGFAVDSATDTLQSMIMQSGVGIWNNTTKTVEFDDEKVYEALDWYGKGVQEGVFLSNPSLSNYFSDDYNAKNIAMYVGSVAGAPYLKESWKTAPMPQTEGGIPWTPAWNRGMLVFDYGDEARIQGAARFIEYFATPEVNTAWCIACNYMTALKTTQEYEGYKTYLASEDPNVAALNALSPETAGAFDAVPAVQYVRNALKNAMADAASGLSGQEAVANAIEYVNEEVASLSGATAEAVATENTGNTDPATVTIWHTYTEAQKDALEKAAADFNAMQDVYTVEVVSQDRTGFDNSVYQAVMAGNGPDIIIDYASTAATYVVDGKSVDLSKFLSAELIDSLNDGAKAEATSFEDGGMHIFPIVFSGPVLFYNPDILEEYGVEVPTTWAEVYEASVKIHEASKQ